MNILVTGGAGFIGSHIAEELSNSRNNIVILDNLSGGFIENIPSNTTFIKGSITNHKLINSIFEKYRFDYVFHLAAYAAENLSHFIRRFNYENNLIGSINLINAAVNYNIKCFVFTSSVAVYGDNELPFREELFPNPSDPYGVAKFAVEQDLKNARELFGMPYIIFRPHNVYGERQNIGDKYRNVVGIFMNQILQKKKLTIFGDGNQTRCFSYVKDVSNIISRSIEISDAYNQIFNIGSDKIITLNQLANQIGFLMGVTPEIEYLQNRKEVRYMEIKHEKINEIIKFINETPLDCGLKKMIEWVRQKGSRKSKSFKNIEVKKYMPPVWLSDNSS